MRKQIAFWTDGTPIPQGSMSATVRGGFANIYDQKAKRLHPWRQAVAEQAKKQMAREGWATIPKPHPCRVIVQLWLPRPPSHYRTGKNAHLVRDSAPLWPTHNNDIDKLLRGVYDALTMAQVFEDDGQVVEGGQSKSYCSPTMQPGAHVTVYSLEGMTQNL